MPTIDINPMLHTLLRSEEKKMQDKAWLKREYHQMLRLCNKEVRQPSERRFQFSKSRLCNWHHTALDPGHKKRLGARRLLELCTKENLNLTFAKQSNLDIWESSLSIRIDTAFVLHSDFVSSKRTLRLVLLQFVKVSDYHLIIVSSIVVRFPNRSSGWGTWLVL